MHAALVDAVLKDSQQLCEHMLVCLCMRLNKDVQKKKYLKLPVTEREEEVQLVGKSVVFQHISVYKNQQATDRWPYFITF